ncbi:MAG: sugar ABC transporter substrate-binding protein [Actinobacteria bacterium]|nr:sugar ABC transporter substrate-binding protein [Actinomycetota bacterium]
MFWFYKSKHNFNKKNNERKEVKKLIVSIIALVTIFSLIFIIGCKSTVTTTPETKAETTPETKAETTASETTAETTASVETSSETVTYETTASTQKVVGFTNVIYANPYAKSVEDEFTRIVTEKGVKVLSGDANYDVQQQISVVENFIAQKIDLLVIMGVDYEGSLPAVLSANEANIPVVEFLIHINPKGKSVYVGSDNVVAGIMQADYFAKVLPQNAKVVYMEGSTGRIDSDQRRDGFINTMKEKRPDVEVLATQTGFWARDKGMAIMEDWLQAFPQIDAVVAGNDEMALGAIQALKDAGKAGKVMVAGIDASDEALQAIKSGEMTISISQNAIANATQCADVAVKILGGQSVPLETIVPFELVSIDNVDQYIK